MRNIFVLLLGLGLTFASCKKTNLTQGQLAAGNLQNAISNIALANIFVFTNNRTTILASGTNITIHGDGMADISSGNGVSYTFNLEQMQGYELSGNVLDLFY